jgi:N-acetyl-1-D-myo-inositol-2-amino-2-deoxy-alpha-D-glucopyranoside deacetylase
MLEDTTSFAHKALLNPDIFPVEHTRAYLSAEIPAANGVSDARSLARLYAAMIGDVDGPRCGRRDTRASAVLQRRALPGEAIAQVVAHIRQFRPGLEVTHDVLGQLTGHPDHRRTHQVALLAVEAAAVAQLYSEAGEPWQTDGFYAATHPHSGVGGLGPLLQRVGKSLLSVPDSYATVTVDVSVINSKGSVIPTLLIKMSKPFVGLAHPGVSGVAFSGLPFVASYDSPPDTPRTTRLLIRNCDPIAE